MKLSLMSSKDSHEKCLNDSKSNSKEIMISVDTEEITRKRFNSLLYWYQVRLDQSMKNSDFFFFMFYYVDGLFYKCHKKRFGRGGSYIGSTEWIENKNSAMNPKK